MKFKLLLVYANLPMDNIIPVGISSLMSSLKKENIDVKLFDTTFYRTVDKTSDEERVELLQVPPFSYSGFGIKFKETGMGNDFRAIVESYKPDLVGFSIVEPTYKMSMDLLDILSEFNIPVITGGIFSIFSPELLIQNDNIDMVCVGEGEKCLPAVCKKISDKKSLKGIQNLWFKENGEVIKNDIELLDVEQLPTLDFSEYESERFFRPMGGDIFKMVPVEFARGCTFKCSYCCNHGLENKFKQCGPWFRKKSIKKVISEIKLYIEKYNVGYFYFVFEIFLGMPMEYLLEFAEEYKKIKIPFWCNTRTETITEEKVKILKEIGCHRMSIGIENGNEEFREKVLRRTITNKKIIESCEILHKNGISFSVNNIIGFPGETRDIIFDTINLNRQVKTKSIGAYMFMPYRGTDIYDYCVEKGYIDDFNISGDCHKDDGLKNNTVSLEELRGLLRTFSLYVNMPDEYYPAIKKAEKNDEEGNAVFAKLSKIYRKRVWGVDS